MAKKQRSAAGDPSANTSEVEAPPAVEAAAVPRPSAETLYAGELLALAEADSDPRRPGWRLSPRAVRSFLCGAARPAIRRKWSLSARGRQARVREVHPQELSGVRRARQRG